MRRAEDVLALHHAGQRVRYLCFWGHQPRRTALSGRAA